MRLLEIVRGEKTSKQVIATSMQLAKKIGKIAALVGVCHGFVGNRMLAARQREANAMLMEGAMPWDVDRVLYDFGLPMGPFAMSDLAGLDIGWVKETSKSATIRDVLCEMDRRGQKTGAGFYDYDEKRNAKPSPVTEKIIKDFIAKAGATARQISDEEILERCIYPMINEGAKILEESKAIRPSDIDIVWINGYGWPVYRGGPMFYGDTVGLQTVVAKMKESGQARRRLQPVAAAGKARGRRQAFPGPEVRSDDAQAFNRGIPMREAVIVSTARTPIGKAYRGAFNNTQGQALGGPRHRASSASAPASIRPRSTTWSWAAPCSRARPAATSPARRRCARACPSPCRA